MTAEPVWPYKAVSTHKVRLMQKLQAHSVADMVRYAIDHKLI